MPNEGSMTFGVNSRTVPVSGLAHWETQKGLTRLLEGLALDRHHVRLELNLLAVDFDSCRAVWASTTPSVHAAEASLTLEQARP
jgi:hypothetical protein